MKLTPDDHADVISKTLRRKAEARMAEITRATVAAMSPSEVQRFFQEVQVHQMVLQIQNEGLIRAQVELAEMRDRYADLYEFAPIG